MGVMTSLHQPLMNMNLHLMGTSVRCSAQLVELSNNTCMHVREVAASSPTFYMSRKKLTRSRRVCRNEAGLEICAGNKPCLCDG